MTLPAFSQAGVGSTGNPSWPTHATGDFGLLLIEWDGTNNPSTPSGWTILPGFPVTQPTTKLAGYYRFATSSSESAPTISITAEDHHWAVILTYAGVNTINPFHLVATTSSGSITLKTFPGFTTFLKDCLIVNVLAWGLDNAGPLFSTETNADLGSLTERYDAGTISASGGGLYVNDGTKSAKGDFTYTQVTASSANVSNGATLALQAADESFGTKSQIVNNRRRTMFVKQSTAQDWRFVMFDSADGVTGKTGLTLAVTIQKQGDTSFSSISPTVTEIGNGHYNAALTTTHMNTVGCVSLRATATGAIPADCPNCIDVIAFDKTDVVRLGLTAIPNAAAEAAGGLYTRGTGAGQIKQSANGQVDANIATWNLNGTAASATVPAALNSSGQPKTDVIRVNTSTTAAANLALQYDGTGLSGGTFPAPQSQVTTLSSDAASGLASLQADTDDIQVKIGTPAGASVSADIATTNGRLTSTRAGYLDNLSAGAVALSSALTTAQTAITAIKAKTDQFAFTVANQVDANAVTGGGGATADDVRDAILDYEYRTGRTLRGLFRRLGAAIEKATGLKGSLVTYYQPDGVTEEFTVAQNPTSGTRSVATVTNSETP